MNVIRQFVLANRLKPKVLHRLPGRLRLHLPILHDVTVDHSLVGEFMTQFIGLPNGIERVEPSMTTGNVLIHYKPDVITEDEILLWLNQLRHIIIKHWEKLSQQKPEEWPQVMERLKKVFNDSMQYRLAFTKEIEIPDDVWP